MKKRYIVGGILATMITIGACSEEGTTVNKEAEKTEVQEAVAQPKKSVSPEDQEKKDLQKYVDYYSPLLDKLTSNAREAQAHVQEGASDPTVMFDPQWRSDLQSLTDDMMGILDDMEEYPNEVPIALESSHGKLMMAVNAYKKGYGAIPSSVDSLLKGDAGPLTTATHEIQDGSVYMGEATAEMEKIND